MDLAINSDITYNTDYITPNAVIDLSVDIVNNGLLPNEDSSLSFYYGNPDTNGTLIGDAIDIGKIATGEERTITHIGWQVPDTLENRQIYAVVSSATETDINLTNNSKSTSLFETDLAIGNTYVVQKSPTERCLVVTVQNRGAFDCSNFGVELEYQGSLIYNQTISSLAAGKSVEVVYDWDVSTYSQNYPASLDLVIKVDADDAIVENVINNTEYLFVPGKRTDFVNTDSDQLPSLIPPVLSVENSCDLIVISWESVSNAQGYYLYYAPYPNADYLEKLDMKNERILQLGANGLSFYIAITAYNEEGESELSNISFFNCK